MSIGIDVCCCNVWFRELRERLMFGDAAEDGLLCVYVGRISREKRIDVLVEAIRDLPGVYLAIIGTPTHTYTHLYTTVHLPCQHCLLLALYMQVTVPLQ